MHRPRAAISVLSHLALWPGLYQAALIMIAARLLKLPIAVDIIIAATLLAISVYLLDRVKPTDALLDPADTIAHPQRSALLYPVRRPLRIIILIFGVAAAAVLYAHHPVAALLSPAAWFGVLFYSAFPRRPRPKDILIIKNLTVAAAMAGLTIVLLALAAPDPIAHFSTWSLADTLLAIILILIITADAMRCDIDDRLADARFGTHTIPNTLSPGATRLIAFALYIIASILILQLTPPAPRLVAYILVLAMVTTGLPLRLGSGSLPLPVRDMVEIRLAIIAVVLILLPV